MGEKFSVEDLQMIDAGLEALMDQFANGIATCPDPDTWADELRMVEATLSRIGSLRARVKHMTPIQGA